MKVLHCITSLHPDGAQRALLRLIPGLHAEGLNSLVLTLTDTLTLRDAFEAAGASVETLRFNSPWMLPANIARLRNVVRRYEPDVIQGWMYHGNLAAWYAGRFGENARVCWNVRTSIASASETKATTRLLRTLSAHLSTRPCGIVYCAEDSKQQHRKAGFRGRREEVIPNGFDTQLFKPSSRGPAALRAALQLPDDAIIIGSAGRFHATKDHATLLAAAAIVLQYEPRVHFALIGPSITQENAALMALMPSEERLRQRIHLLGPHSEPHKIISAFSIYCSSSALEGFPNAIGEAMACGLPVVATDAGGSREVMGDCGTIVPVRDPHALASALLQAAERSPDKLREMGVAARQRVEEVFSLRAMVARYRFLYEDLVHGKAERVACAVSSPPAAA